MTKLTLLVLLALASCAIAQSATVDSAINSFKKSDTIFAPKLFKMMLMIPTTKDNVNVDNQKVHPDVQQVDIQDEVHPNDLIGSALKDFFNKGGDSSFAHVFSKFGDVKTAFGKWIMEATTNSKGAKTLTHGGKHVTTLKSHNLQNCLVRNDIGVKLSVVDGSYTLTFANKKTVSFTEDSFAPFETFLTDLCTLVEYSQKHYNDYRSGLMIHHLESFNAAASSEHSADFLAILHNSIEVVKSNIAKAYGAKNIMFMVSKFVQSAAGSLPKLLHHNRVLSEEEADTGEEHNRRATDGQPDNEAYAHSIRLIFGIVFLFLIMYTSVYLYRMEVYKDSLIYSRFITTRKDKKNA